MKIIFEKWQLLKREFKFLLVGILGLGLAFLFTWTQTLVLVVQLLIRLIELCAHLLLVLICVLPITLALLLPTALHFCPSQGSFEEYFKAMIDNNVPPPSLVSDNSNVVVRWMANRVVSTGVNMVTRDLLKSVRYRHFGVCRVAFLPAGPPDPQHPPPIIKFVGIFNFWFPFQ